MQFSAIITAFSLALVASAIPNPSGSAAPAPAPTAPTQACSANQVESCCTVAQKGVLPIGLDCVTVAVLQLFGGTCSGNSVALSCCQTNQKGLINVGGVCPAVAV